MDPERIHSYLQAACAGLGFDIGEVWFSSLEKETSSVPLIEQRISASDALEKDRSMKFLQLYTSKSFNSRRNDLLKPDNEDSDSEQAENNVAESIQKHMWSPMMVKAIATNARVMWANCQKQEGLLGRSDMRLQTAVGVPVAMDNSGNMCIVVMFSPRNVSSNKDAMEFLKLIGQGAASSDSIPCLLPVVDRSQKKLVCDPKRFSDWQQNEVDSDKRLTLDAVFAREGQSFKVINTGNEHENNELVTTNDALHEITLLPQDQYGIPMLPEFAELNTENDSVRGSGASSPTSDDMGEANEFDSATYGLWSTIMNSPKINGQPDPKNELSISTLPLLQHTTMIKHDEFMNPERKERLEEFTSAFLGLSVFDVADVWVPITNAYGNVSLYNVFAVSSAGVNETNVVRNFKNLSRNTVITAWSGAVGRAQCSGNPVWSTNQGIIVDAGRKDAFIAADIRTALAVPVFSAEKATPSCILCCYSMVKSDSVTFILRFLQHALRSLWAGLDSVQPHYSIGKDLWKGVAPADLGEMAADTEMQKAFYRKKRPFEMITKNTTGRQVERRPDNRARSSSLAYQLQSIQGIKTSYHQQHYQQQRSGASLSSNHPAPVAPLTSQFADTVQPPSTNTVPSNPSLPAAPLLCQYTNTVQNPSTNIPTFSQAMNALNPSPAPVAPPVSRFTYHVQPPSTNIVPSNPTVNQVTNEIHPSSYTSFAPAPQPQQSYNSNQVIPATSTSVSMPSLNPNNFKEDLAVAKSYIDTINALVQQNGGQNNYQNIANANFAPESTTSSGCVIQPPINPIPNTTPANSFPDTTVSKVSGKTCRIEGCNILSVSRRPYCTRHSGNRLCEYIHGCTKCAQGATRFCIAHGGGRRCTFPGCDKGARDKFFCAAHGGGKRCSKDGCTKSAVGGSSLCTSHGGGRRCAVEGCEKSAQSSTKFCVKHGGGKKCAHEGCGKVARGRTLFCAGHGGGVRCKLEGCSRIAIGKMQLCRAHGGGSSRARARAVTTIVPQDVTPPPQAFLQPSMMPAQPAPQGTIFQTPYTP